MAWNKEVTCRTGEVVKSYDAYLQTKHWKETGLRIRKQAGGKCSKCGVSFYFRPLHIHHISYENLGNESDSDLVCICSTCHRNIHGIKIMSKGKILKDCTVEKLEYYSLRMKHGRKEIEKIFKTSKDPFLALKEVYSVSYSKRVMRSPLFKDVNKEYKYHSERHKRLYKIDYKALMPDGQILDYDSNLIHKIGLK